jgi:hypothetical protein
MLYSEGKGFGGFEPSHFAAFEQAKWASHRFNLERMKVSAVLEALRGSLSAGLEAPEEGLTWSLSSAHPEVLNAHRVDCLWLFLNRTDKERETVEKGAERELSLAQMIQRPNAMHRIAFVGVRVHSQGLEWGLWVHANAVLDHRNLEAALKDPFERTKLPPLLGKLPLGTLVRSGSAELTLETWLEQNAERLQPWEDYLFFGRSLDPQASAEAGASVQETLRAELPRFLTLYRFLAWSSTNDRQGLAKQLKEEKKDRVKKQSGLEKGDRVRVTRGLLSGQLGTIQELDARGKAKVLIGRISIELQVDMLSKA